MEGESTAYTGWAVVELFGRRRYAGHVTEVVQFGVAMGRLDVPETADAPAQTIFFGGESVYQLSPVSEEAARAVAQYSRPEPVHTFELTPKTRAIEALRRSFGEPGYEPPYDEDDESAYDQTVADEDDDEDDPNEYQPVDGAPREPFTGPREDDWR